MTTITARRLKDRVDVPVIKAPPTETAPQQAPGGEPPSSKAILRNVVAD
jgi:hypothetical protein